MCCKIEGRSNDQEKYNINGTGRHIPSMHKMTDSKLGKERRIEVSNAVKDAISADSQNEISARAPVSESVSHCNQ